MSRRILILAIAASLAPVALQAREPRPEMYYQGKLLQSWFQQLAAPFPPLRYEAVLALGQVGPPAKAAIPYLRELASKDEDAAVRAAAAEALESILVSA